MSENQRVPTNEWFTSSNYDNIVHLNGGYSLGLGYCYLEQAKFFFDSRRVNFEHFRVNWGWCGTNFLFSALRPDNIIVLTSWANSSMTCGRTTVLFHIWRAILRDLIATRNKDGERAPLMVVDMPCATSMCFNKKNEPLDIEFAKNRRAMYKEQVIKDSLGDNFFGDLEYVDLMDHFGGDWIMIVENAKAERSTSPWHMDSSVIGVVVDHFLKFSSGSYNRPRMLSDLDGLKP
jgi:hypothetical protein